VQWEGKVPPHAAEFRSFLTGPVRQRVNDEPARARYEAEMRALATTEMASETITQLLASEPDINDR
jgi:hypothetical protein